jgi:hypothetical protein
MRSIGQELERINSRPIELSVIKNAKSFLEAKLKYLAGLQEIATPEEAHELDAEAARLRAQLDKMDAELAARADEEEAKPGIPLARNEVLGSESSATTVERKTTDYVLLFNQVLERSKRSGESATAALEGWLNENRGLCRTQVTDYRAGRIKGRVSASKCKAIEAAIRASAQELGLPTRTDSD